MTEAENKDWAITTLTGVIEKLKTGQLRAHSCTVAVDSGSVTNAAGTKPYPNGEITVVLKATDTRMAHHFDLVASGQGVTDVQRSIDKNDVLDAEMLDNLWGGK